RPSRSSPRRPRSRARAPRNSPHALTVRVTETRGPPNAALRPIRRPAYSCGASHRRYVTTFGCPDRTGTVAGIATLLAAAGRRVLEAAYHPGPGTNRFFTRQEVRADSLPYDVDQLRARFEPVAQKLGGEQAQWRIDDTGEKRRVVILVSKEG